MSRRSTWTNVKLLVAALTTAGVCLVTTATCDPSTGTFEFFRDDDRDRFGVIDFIFDDPCFFDDCFHHDDLFFFD